MRIFIHPSAVPKIRDHRVLKDAPEYVVKTTSLAGEYQIEIDPQKLQKYHIDKDIPVSQERIKQDFLSLKRLSERLCGSACVRVAEDDLTDVFFKIEEEYIVRRRIVLEDDLSVVARHPLIASSSTAWRFSRSGDRWYGKLSHPSNAEKDIDNWQATGFYIYASDAALDALSSRVNDDEQKGLVAHVERSGHGVRLTIHTSMVRAEQALSKTDSVRYNAGPNQIELLHLIKKEKKGTYIFPEFLLPYVARTIKENGVETIDGFDEIYPKFEKFSFSCSLKGSLRDVQKQAFAAWKKDEFGTIVLPTGAGKTLVGINAIVESQIPTLVVVPSLEIQDHWKEEISKWTTIPESQIGTYSAEKKELKPVTIITYQSGYRVLEEEDQPPDEAINDEFFAELANISQRFGQLILDEGHHSPAKVFRRIMMTLKAPKRMNLTATAERHDSNETLSFMAAGPVVFRTDYVSLARQGVVCPIEYKKILVSLNETETELVYNLAKLRGDLAMETNRLRIRGDQYGLTKLESDKGIHRKRIRELSRQIEYNRIDPEHSYRIAKRKIFGFAASKLAKIVEIVQSHKNGRILIFNQLRKGTKIIHNYLLEHGIHSEILTGGPGSRSTRRQVFSDFITGRNRIIVTTNVLDEGANVPSCDVAIIVNGTERKLQMVQRAGRTARPAPLKIGYVYELVAHVDHKLYKPEYSDSKKFSDVSMYEINVSNARDISDVLGCDQMKALVQHIYALRDQKTATA